MKEINVHLNVKYVKIKQKLWYKKVQQANTQPCKFDINNEKKQI